MNSWKSTFVSACAPPLRMFIIGTGSSRAAGAGRPARATRGTRRAARAGAGGRGVRGGHRHAEHRVGAEARLVRRAVERDQRARRAPAGPRRAPASAAAISPLTWPTALRTPLPPYRFGSPSRSSSASRVPVDAPDGTAARPRAPDSRTTSTSTVGIAARVQDFACVDRSKLHGISILSGRSLRLLRPRPCPKIDDRDVLNRYTRGIEKPMLQLIAALVNG